MGCTIKDVAQRAGVSPSTVSRVLNENSYVSDEARGRVQRAMRELQYSPSAAARSLSHNINQTLGIIVPDICNPFFTEVFSAASQMAEKNGYRLLLYNSNENVAAESSAIQDMLSNRVKGLLITPVADDNLLNVPLLLRVQEAGIPIVFIDREMKGMSCDGVFIDNVRGAYEATSLLLRGGHKKIAIIAGPVNTIPGRERVQGYLKAMEEAGCPVPQEYMLYGDFKSESAYHLANAMLSLPHPPTAVFTCNNLMTLGCLKALLARRMRIPEDMAMVGFDEVDFLDMLGIHISLVARATTEMGRIAVRLLLGHIHAPAENAVFQRVVLQPHLNVRGSERLARPAAAHNA